ncbi:hypothetical protein J3Q64DRAFT_1765614, partial [Phycomyces blakesleeanus]
MALISFLYFFFYMPIFSIFFYFFFTFFVYVLSYSFLFMLHLCIPRPSFLLCTFTLAFWLTSFFLLLLFYCSLVN